MECPLILAFCRITSLSKWYQTIYNTTGIKDDVWLSYRVFKLQILKTYACSNKLAGFCLDNLHLKYIQRSLFQKLRHMLITSLPNSEFTHYHWIPMKHESNTWRKNKLRKLSRCESQVSKPHTIQDFLISKCRLSPGVHKRIGTVLFSTKTLVTSYTRFTI